MSLIANNIVPEKSPLGPRTEPCGTPQFPQPHSVSLCCLQDSGACYLNDMNTKRVDANGRTTIFHVENKNWIISSDDGSFATWQNGANGFGLKSCHAKKKKKWQPTKAQIGSC